MGDRAEQRVCVLVMEAGGEWPSFLDREEPVNWAVIPQQPGETPGELALRSSHRVNTLTDHGAAINTVIIAAGPDYDDHIFAARCSIARALIQAMGGREGQLLFSACSRLPQAARHELVVLAGTLANQMRGTSLTVGVRFPDAPPRSRPAPREEKELEPVAV